MFIRLHQLLLHSSIDMRYSVVDFDQQMHKLSAHSSSFLSQLWSFRWLCIHRHYQSICSSIDTIPIDRLSLMPVTHVAIIVFGTDISHQSIGSTTNCNSIICIYTSLYYYRWLFRTHLYLFASAKKFTDADLTRRMQTRLLYALLVQSVLPAICLLASTANYVIFMFDNDDDGADRWSQFISFITPHYLPIINPIVTICFISPYRRALVTLLKSGKLYSPLQLVEEHQQLQTSCQVIDRVSWFGSRKSDQLNLKILFCTRGYSLI